MNMEPFATPAQIRGAFAMLNIAPAAFADSVGIPVKMVEKSFLEEGLKNLHPNLKKCLLQLIAEELQKRGAVFTADGGAKIDLEKKTDIPGESRRDPERSRKICRNDPVLQKRVDELELSTRSAKCLKNDNIVYIRDLIQRCDADILRTPNFGPKSLREIKEVIAQMGLRLGMDIVDPARPYLIGEKSDAID